MVSIYVYSNTHLLRVQHADGACSLHCGLYSVLLADRQIAIHSWVRGCEVGMSAVVEEHYSATLVFCLVNDCSQISRLEANRGIDPE